ncbi:MAG: hypothetical protein HYR56_14290 [Acidobacteria bacterium]|nr:hypothetical protein [Acidobacteriota bacterium]MBI3423804.1 hypothetical protein [Acidobacteriota bacterium]
MVILMVAAVSRQHRKKVKRAFMKFPIWWWSNELDSAADERRQTRINPLFQAALSQAALIGVSPRPSAAKLF